jgi:hypothetical protein
VSQRIEAASSSNALMPGDLGLVEEAENLGNGGRHPHPRPPRQPNQMPPPVKTSLERQCTDPNPAPNFFDVMRLNCASGFHLLNPILTVGTAGRERLSLETPEADSF